MLHENHLNCSILQLQVAMIIIIPESQMCNCAKALDSEILVVGMMTIRYSLPSSESVCHCVP